MTMTNFDFSPLFRTMIGFDRLASAMESASRADAGGYPPYNVEVTGEDRYRITMAVAGFREAELDVQVKDTILTVTGQKQDDDKGRKFLYRGIATRGFERQFQLADYVRVAGAELRDGLLDIALVREVPEAMKPRRIEIRSDDKRVIEGKLEQAA